MKGNWQNKTYRKEFIMSQTQNQQILEYLQKGLSITPLEALEKFGCFRLGARIFNLRQSGYNIITEHITEKGKTFAKYSLIDNGGNNVK
tara:strand:+ start:910 stop:1176 length:267 start_codon:yes stop_codon:yes gene_type:complete